jgi:hypothetical protein
VRTNGVNKNHHVHIMLSDCYDTAPTVVCLKYGPINDEFPLGKDKAAPKGRPVFFPLVIFNTGVLFGKVAPLFRIVHRY